MNFTEFSFWWILGSFLIPFLVIRQVFVFGGLWREEFDRKALMLLSLTLFWNAAASSFLIFIVELAVNYAVVRWITTHDRAVASKFLGYFTIGLDLTILAYFKYLDFLAENLLSPFIGDDLSPGAVANIPPGISFYTFQMIAFLVDTLKGKRQGAPSFIDYVNFASFFPQIVAGPIERRADLLPQAQQFRFTLTSENLDRGLRWLVFGFFMKFVLADNLSPFVLMENTGNAWIIWFSALLFGFRIYFDFAGYSFIGLGIAQMLGVRLTVNFLAPYAAVSLTDFWRRWHITLSGWFRDYVYMPLGGSRSGWVKANIMVVFCVSGLWHGAGWNFILWGSYHGVLMVFLRKTERFAVRLPSWVTKISTFGLVTMGWLLFMDQDFGRIELKVETICTPASYCLTGVTQLLQEFSIVDRGVLFVSLLLTGVVFVLEFIGSARNVQKPYELLLSTWPVRVMLILTVLCSASSPSDFVYFAF